jgi:hypothetical protein
MPSEDEASVSEQLASFRTPEEQHLAELERTLEDLIEQLTANEAEFRDTGSAFARFRAAYLRRFAPLYAELDRLEAEVARRIALGDATPAAWARASAAASQAEETQRAVDEGPHDGAATASVTADPALKALYRDAAKRIHPDLATDEPEKERRHELMTALNAAYAAGDADAIEQLLTGEASRPEAILGDDTGARLMRALRRIAQVRARLVELEQQAVALRSDPLFVLFEECRPDLAAGRDPLEPDEASLRERIPVCQAEVRHGR